MQQVELGTKERIHQIVDELEQGESEWLLELLEEHMADPFLQAHRNAPLEDEEISPEEEAAVEEAREEIRRGEYVTADEAKRRLLG
jgi:hypothetical protein